jgi:hypothetical protein
MYNPTNNLSGRLSVIFCLLLLLTTAPTVQAALSDYNEDQQLSYEIVAKELARVNGVTQQAIDIEPETFWVDTANGIDADTQTGKIDQPWKSIRFAMSRVPYDKDTANIVVREGTYSPEVLYFEQLRGGNLSLNTPFNLMAYPGEKVVIDGANVNSALVSIASAQKITISGLEFSNVLGAGKSVIYIADSSDIVFTNNIITNAKWTNDPDEAESPTLADRLNAIAVVGLSTNIMINNNNLRNLVTGYGEPILVTQDAYATVIDNTISDVDPSSFSGQRYYVSTDGNDDTGIGTKDKPWNTIKQALIDIPLDEDDATVIIRGGTYKIPEVLYFDSERGGSEGKYFTIRAYKDEEVIIDGSLLVDNFSAMVSFSAASYIRIKGLTFTNLKGNKSGIYITNTSHHIRIINNTLRDMTWVVDDATEDSNKPSPSDNLNPIAVIGNHPTQPVHNIVIRGNELNNIVPGYSEGIKIVGNVTDFVVAKNHIHHIANIGIVAAGNYTWVKDSSNTTIPADVNHARNGVIRDNLVHHAVSPVANSAGIYLDGARNVLVRGNTSHNNGVGFSVGSEQAGDATGNTLRRNIAYDNYDAGLVVGTADANVVAFVKNTTIVKNEFRNNYTRGGYGGEMTIQSVDGLKVINNLFSSRSDIMIVASQPSKRLTLENNLYHGISDSADKAVFDWGGIDGMSHFGLSAYQSATCNDLQSIYQGAKTIEYVDGLKKHNKPKGRSKNQLLRKIRRACYNGKKIW